MTDFLNVLDAERQLFELQDQYATAQANVVRDFVSVYKSLGGGDVILYNDEKNNISALVLKKLGITPTASTTTTPVKKN